MSNLVPYNELKEMSVAVATSGMFGFKNEGQALTLMLIAQSENIHPMSAIQQYDIIQGRPALKATETLARYQKSGGSIEWINTDAKSAKAKFVHPNSKEFEFEYTIEDAKLAGLTDKQNWKQRPKEMLRARCVSAGVRMSYPACLGNKYTSDEVEDMPYENSDNPNGIPIAKVTNDVVDVEIEQSIPTLKIMLKNQLTKLSFSSADIKEFATKFNLAEDNELLEKLVNDKKLLMSMVEQFENGESK